MGSSPLSPGCSVSLIWCFDGQTSSRDEVSQVRGAATTRFETGERMTLDQSNAGRVLVILTNEYPTVEIGESFIGNELRYISEPWDEVFFIPRFPREARFDVLAGTTVQLPTRTLRVPPPSRADLVNAAARMALTSTAARSVLRARPQLPASSRGPVLLSAAKKVVALEDRVHKAGLLLRHELAGKRPTFYSYWFHSSAYVARRLAEEFGSEAVCRAHRYDLYPSASWDSAWHHACIGGLSAVFACSRNGQKSLREELPGYSDKIHLSYLGTEDHGIQSFHRLDEFRLVTCSRRAAVKRLDRVIDALRLAAPHLPPTRWIHLGGSASARDDRLFEEQARRVLPPHVRIEVKGVVRNAEVVSHYQRERVDLFVNVSDSEGVPVSIMEALSFGIPVAATAVGGTPEMIRHGENGYLLPLEDVPGSLSRVLTAMANRDEANVASLRDRARKSWENGFCASVNYPKFFERVATLAT